MNKVSLGNQGYFVKKYVNKIELNFLYLFIALLYTLNTKGIHLCVRKYSTLLHFTLLHTWNEYLLILYNVLFL